jgi:hypothetical protein
MMLSRGDDRPDDASPGTFPNGGNHEIVRTSIPHAAYRSPD